jgi:hypothetical protein
MINLKTCKIIFWGFKNTYNTFGHIHEGMYRAAKRLGREAYWIDEKDYESVDFFNALVVSEPQAINKSTPINNNCVYLIHNLNSPEIPEDSKRTRELLQNYNVINYGVYAEFENPPKNTIMLDNGYMPVYPKDKTFSMLWATDIFPEDIENYKKFARIFNPDSKTIYFIGSDRDNLGPFVEGCKRNNIAFKRVGGWNAPDSPRIGIEENITLVQQSRFAPTIVIGVHTNNPYIPCRILKNISYGRFGVTNSKYVNEFLQHEVIFNPDSNALVDDAERLLPTISLKVLRKQMDWVAKYHTYLNRISEVIRAVEIIQEEK